MTAHPTTQVIDGLVARIDELRRAFAAGLSGARRGDERAVHATRVAARRLREALAIGADVAPTADAKHPSRALRRIRRTLGPVREADVMRIVLEDEQAARRWAPTALAVLREGLEAERARRARRAARGLRGTSARLRLRSVRAALGARTDDRGVRDALGIRARRRAQGLATAVARAGTIYDPTRLHGVRLAAKKLRYVLEAAEATGAWITAREVERLREIQDLLGHLNDIEVLRAFVKAMAEREARKGRDSGALEAVERDLQVESRRLHAGVVAELPTLALLAGELATNPTRGKGGRRRMLRMAASPSGSVATARRAGRRGKAGR